MSHYVLYGSLDRREHLLALFCGAHIFDGVRGTVVLPNLRKVLPQTASNVWGFDIIVPCRLGWPLGAIFPLARRESYPALGPLRQSCKRRRIHESPLWQNANKGRTTRGKV